MNLVNVTNKRKRKNSLPTECSECIESSECSVWFEEFFWLIPSECWNQALAQNYGPNIPYVMNLANVTNKRRRTFFLDPLNVVNVLNVVFLFFFHLFFNVAKVLWL